MGRCVKLMEEDKKRIRRLIRGNRAMIRSAKKLASSGKIPKSFARNFISDRKTNLKQLNHSLRKGYCP